MLCPHCMYPLLTSAYNWKQSTTPGVADTMVGCTHCSAILRIEITTLKEPNVEKLKKKNLPMRDIRKDE